MRFFFLNNSQNVSKGTSTLELEPVCLRETSDYFHSATVSSGRWFLFVDDFHKFQWLYSLSLIIGRMFSFDWYKAVIDLAYRLMFDKMRHLFVFEIQRTKSIWILWFPLFALSNCYLLWFLTVGKKERIGLKCSTYIRRKDHFWSWRIKLQ